MSCHEKSKFLDRLGLKLSLNCPNMALNICFLNNSQSGSWILWFEIFSAFRWYQGLSRNMLPITLFLLVNRPTKSEKSIWNIGHVQCATGNPVPVPVDPVVFFRSGSGPVPAKYRPDLTSKFGCRIWYHVTFCMLFWPFGKFDFEIWVEEEGNFPTFLGWFWALVNNVGHGAKWGQKLKSAPKTECQNRMKSYRVMPIRWSHAKFGHIF